MVEGKRWVAYYRVSTAKQGASGLGREAQVEAVSQHIKAAGGRLVAEFEEVESGRKKDRPALAAALAACRTHRAVLVIAKLDRLARNVALVSNLMESKVEFVAVDMPSANRLTVHILAAVAEEEARMISARTKAALAAAKARGTTLGGRRAGSFKLDDATRMKGTVASAAKRGEKAREQALDLATAISRLREQGCVSLGQLAARLNEQGIPAPRGGMWQPMQVSRVLKHLGAISGA